MSPSHDDSDTTHHTLTRTHPVVSYLPTELLVIIYNHLSPRDFDNARRTCSRWMRVSLDRDLLQRMLKRGGWWRAWQRDCQIPRSTAKLASGKAREGLEWRLSKRLAMECWLSNRGVHENNKRMMMTSVFDFSGLSGGSFGEEEEVVGGRSRAGGLGALEPSLDFTVSSCGEFVLVADGNRIHIFRLFSRPPARAAEWNSSHHAVNNGLDVEPITSIECPRTVLAVSVDTTKGRFGIAALMCGRDGIVFEMISEPAAPYHGSPQNKLEQQSRTFFDDICTPEDPPRSVSISPERRCVAFGCASGIELHWVDVEGSVPIRRWFPIPVPSDVLHFLPQRAGWESSPRQLRMLSSAAGPVGVEDIVSSHSRMGRPCKPVARMFYGGNAHTIPATRPRRESTTGMRATGRDHYRALPLSDGYNMLFTDPDTGRLCLGSDAPLGGPTKLMKKIICVPPPGSPGTPSKEDRGPPSAYAAGSNIDWGVRIVAAYRNRIILFCVPPDVFDAIKSERERQGDGVMGDSDLARDFFLGETRRHRRGTFAHNGSGNWEFLLSQPLETSQQQKLWPIPIVGKEIGVMNDIVEFAVQSSNGGLRIWAFGATGEARVLDINTVASSPSSSPSQSPDSDQRVTGVKKVVLGPGGTIGSTELLDRYPSDPGMDHSLSSSASSSCPATPPSENEDDSNAANNTLNHNINNNKLSPQDLDESPFGFGADEFGPDEFNRPYATEEGVLRRYSALACILDLELPRLGG
ncbi:hypothetical protein FQN54_007094 [Arachnomyces sp. PD_36]|nr:hypothetical protein FQN54_007094 [Arachnomyces sp. PD_36]